MELLGATYSMFGWNEMKGNEGGGWNGRMTFPSFGYQKGRGGKWKGENWSGEVSYILY